RRLDLVLHAIKAGHQHRWESEVRITARIGRPELKAPRLLAARISRNAYTGAAISLRIRQVNRRFVTWHETPIRIGCRLKHSAQCERMFQQAADVPTRRVAQ